MGRPFVHAHLAHLPRKGGVYLYALSLPGGIVKVGFTSRPRERALQYERELEFTVSAMHVHRLPNGDQGWAHERIALDRINAIASVVPGRREYFSGLSYGEAVSVISMAPHAPEPAEAAQEG